MRKIPNRKQQLRLHANRGVGLIGELLECGQELPALTGEQSIGREACNRSHCARKPIGQRTNDGDMRQAGVDEFARNWKDQAGLNEGRGLQWWVVEKIGK